MDGTKLLPILLTISLLTATCQTRGAPATVVIDLEQYAPTPDPAGLDRRGLPEAGAVGEAEGTAGVPITGGDARFAIIAEAVGLVEWRAAVGADWSAVTLGQLLAIGHQVRTGVESRATIVLTEGTVTRVAANSLFAVSDLSGDAANPVTRFELFAGQLFGIVRNALGAGRFEINTPVGVASVRGSWTSVRLTPSGRLVVTCLEGQCRIENSFGAVDLDAGEQSAVTSSTDPPTPARKMETYQINEWFRNDPESVNQAVAAGLVTAAELPAGCDPQTGSGCELPLPCEPQAAINCKPSPESAATTAPQVTAADAPAATRAGAPNAVPTRVSQQTVAADVAPTPSNTPATSSTAVPSTTRAAGSPTTPVAETAAPDTPTPAPTATFTWTPSPIPAPTDTAVPTVDACAGLGAGGFSTSAKTAYWTITNGSGAAITLMGVSLQWPNGNGALTKIKFDNPTIWTGDAPPPSTSISSGWTGVSRVMGPSQSRQLTFEFSAVVAPGGYLLVAMFDNGCGISVGG